MTKMEKLLNEYYGTEGLDLEDVVQIIKHGNEDTEEMFYEIKSLLNYIKDEIE